ncbi:hypothetical protein HMPREF9501_00481 [Enterococcus faecalis TX0027]|nr:hypothetical protein HMPREF9501_00481 [Enterococcus faecalis TX0027]
MKIISYQFVGTPEKTLKLNNKYFKTKTKKTLQNGELFFV